MAHINPLLAEVRTMILDWPSLFDTRDKALYRMFCYGNEYTRVEGKVVYSGDERPTTIDATWDKLVAWNREHPTTQRELKSLHLTLSVAEKLTEIGHYSKTMTPLQELRDLIAHYENPEDKDLHPEWETITNYKHISLCQSMWNPQGGDEIVLPLSDRSMLLTTKASYDLDWVRGAVEIGCKLTTSYNKWLTRGYVDNERTDDWNERELKLARTNLENIQAWFMSDDRLRVIRDNTSSRTQNSRTAEYI